MISKKYISVYDFIRAFKEYNRETNFSREGLCVIYDYLCSLEKALEEEIQLDVISICIEFSEYDNMEEALEMGGNNLDMIPGGILDNGHILVRDT